MEDLWGRGAVLNKLGRLYHNLGQEKQALADYSRALKQRRETKDIWGEGQTLLEIGMLYFEQQRYDAALASFLLSQEYFEKVQSPDQERVREQINVLHAAVGEQEFILLSAKVKSQVFQIVKKSLLDDNA
jgi:tetratricopeptide (TPR) repeat protein